MQSDRAMAQQDQQVIGPSEIPLETSVEVSWNSSPTGTELSDVALHIEDRVGECHPQGDTRWQLLWLAVESSRQAISSPKNGLRKGLSHTQHTN